MNYQSTRNENIRVSDLQAIVDGLSKDGGLYCLPKPFPFSVNLEELLKKDFNGIMETVIGLFFPSFSADEIHDLVTASYDGKFNAPETVPVKSVGEVSVLELFHGPTSAFKDVALSLLPRLMTTASKKLGKKDQILILTATSGDTGKAAMEGFKNVPGARVIVFYPDGGVSPVQKAQMATQEGDNVLPVAIRGNFDDAQTAVKSVFTTVTKEDLLAESGVVLSSANSINIARLVPQISYYFCAYKALLESGKIVEPAPVDFVVPTGNFGDILAGFFAKLLGLPVGRLISASNENDVLADFFATGRYNRKRAFYKTTSPSMDILVSSNLERLLYMTAGTQKTSEWMSELASKGEFTVSDSIKEKLAEDFGAGTADQAEAAEIIHAVYKESHYLLDPHTAVAYTVGKQYAEKHPEHNPIVILSTASPYKFPKAVLEAIGETPTGDDFADMELLHDTTGFPVPKNLAGLKERPVRHKDVIEKNEILEYVLEKALKKAWFK